MYFYFNKHRKLKSFYVLFKRKVRLALEYIPTRLTASSRMLPSFFIIGVMKGGTTSLFEYLGQHPEIELPREKEIMYFSRHYRRSINFYRSFFQKAQPNKITGEASTIYFLNPHVPARIKKDFPNAKIILLLRDPIKRAYSNYNMIKAVDPGKTFEEALELDKKRCDPLESKFLTSLYNPPVTYEAFNYLKKGLYYEQLSEWLKYYSIDDLLILKSEDFYKNTNAELKKVYQYLGIKEVYPEDTEARNSRKYQTPLSEETYERLKAYFHEDQLKLQELLGENFKWW